MTGLRVVDPLTLEMQLDTPNSAVPYRLSMTMASIVPKAYVEEIGSEAFEQQPIGSGPYQDHRVLTGRVARRCERNEDYWDQENAGYVDGIDWELNVDPQLATLRIIDGEADFTHDKIPRDSWPRSVRTPATTSGPSTTSSTWPRAWSIRRRRT